MQETKVKKGNKGITLVALVITVILLLILAGIGIGAIAGEDGLLSKAKQSAEEYNQAARNEANTINDLLNILNGGEAETPVIDAEGNVQFTYTPSTPTRGSVTVGITTTTGYQIQYRTGTSGNFSRYTGAFTVDENTAIYVKLANSSGITGGVATGNVQNIDKIAPNAFTPTIGEITANSIVVNASTIDTGSVGCAAINTGIKEYKYYVGGELKYTGTEESVTITGLTEGTEYSIYVIAEDKAGNTTSNAVTAEIKVVTAADINQNPSEYYGEEVEYTPTNGAPVGWKIFYADEENIYLIASDYVVNTYAPNAANGTPVNKTEGSTYKIYFTDIANNSAYIGTVDIKGDGTAEHPGEDTRVKKWISHIDSFTSTYNNMKATAYLLDTSIWSGYKDSNNKAEYVIGGPTLELFIASYNDTHETDINYEVTGRIGYRVKWSTDASYSHYITGLDTSESLYINDSTDTNAYGYWLASPCEFDGALMFRVNYDGGVGNRVFYIEDSGFRPIVCLKSGIQLVEQESGKYAID